MISRPGSSEMAASELGSKPPSLAHCHRHRSYIGYVALIEYDRCMAKGERRKGQLSKSSIWTQWVRRRATPANPDNPPPHLRRRHRQALLHIPHIPHLPAPTNQVHHTNFFPPSLPLASMVRRDEWKHSARGGRGQSTQ